jgi:hypothetical protein
LGHLVLAMVVEIEFFFLVTLSQICDLTFHVSHALIYRTITRNRVLVLLIYKASLSEVLIHSSRCKGAEGGKRGSEGKI